jgi:hypothetical protein
MFASDMRTLFQDVIYTPRIHAVGGGNVVLEFASPMPQPNVNCIVECQPIRLISTYHIFSYV